MAAGEGFDVVIAGGGAAGCVAAARLVAASSWSVLLLEAGPDLRGKLPAGLRDGCRLSGECDWGYRSEPDGRGVVEHLRRGKLLGGTSWVTRFAFRGSAADYDAWAAAGNVGWGFPDILPYFNRLESDADFGDQPWHGARGPMPIRRYRDVELTDIATAGLLALEAAGFPSVDDHNRPGAVGAGRMPMNARDGIRVTTADAYLPLGGTPPNLTIRADAQMTEVVFDGTRARGVRLLDGTVIESGCVVLSAGAYGTPPILMRSGIGPAEHLRSVGVPVRLDLPGVGTNLADHIGVDIDCGYRAPTRSAPILHLVATFHSATTAEDQAPDLLLWLSDPRGPAEGPAVFEIDVVLLKPWSRGSVRLRSPHPADPPVINLPNLRDPSDIERLADGYRRGLEVAGRPEIRRLCAEPLPPHPSDADDLAALVRADGCSLPHVVGTCAMGTRPEDAAVVDPSGRVHGTERLRVIDASVMPDAPSGFTHIPTIMIAERLAEQLAADLLSEGPPCAAHGLR